MNLSMSLGIGARPPEVRAAYRYSSVDRMLDLTFDFGAVEPDALASLAPELAPLAGSDFPISGTLKTRVDLATLATEGARLDLGFGAGSLRSELLPEGVLAQHRQAVAGVGGLDQAFDNVERCPLHTVAEQEFRAARKLLHRRHQPKNELVGLFECYR
jgi:hypothetical protein